MTVIRQTSETSRALRPFVPLLGWGLHCTPFEPLVSFSFTSFTT